MPQYSCSVRGRPQDATAPLGILVPDDHGVQVQRIIFPPIQRVPRSDTRRPHDPHSLQCGPGRHHPPLGDGGGGNQVGH